MSDGPDELLESRHWQPGRRTLAAVGAVVIVVAVGAVVVTRDADGPERRAAAPTASIATSTTRTPAPSASTVPRVACLDVGDSTLNCGVSAALPAVVTVAARTVLPRAKLVSASTVTGRDGKVFSRRALFRGGEQSTLRIRISAANGQTGGYSVNGLDDGLSVQYGTDVRRRHVEISVRTLPGTPTPAVDALRTLAVDARLFALS